MNRRDDRGYRGQRAAWGGWGLLVLGACCQPGEQEFTSAVRARIAAGPEAACCNPPGSPGCAEEARVRCGYLEGATVISQTVQPLPYGGAQVESVVQSPRGRGRCTHQLHRDGPDMVISAGTCGPSAAASSPAGPPTGPPAGPPTSP